MFKFFFWIITPFGSPVVPDVNIIYAIFESENCFFLLVKFFILGCTDETIWLLFIKSYKGSIQFWSCSVSLFKNNKYSAVECFEPKLQPPAYPKFLLELIMMISSKILLIFSILFA